MFSSAVLTFLGAAHVYWACGGRAGKAQVIPHQSFRPGKFGTLAVGLGLFGAAGIVLSSWRVGNLLLAAIFGLRFLGDFRYVGIAKSVRATTFAKWDTWLYSPVSAALSIGCLVQGGLL